MTIEAILGEILTEIRGLRNDLATPASLQAAPVIAPPPAPVIAPPPAPEQVFAAPSATPAIDKDGLPWDSRIHASTKAINADGRWKSRRGVDAATVASVQAELRTAAAAPGPQGHICNQPWPFPAEDEKVPVTTFSQLSAVLSGKITSKEMTLDQILGVLGQFGIPSFPVLATREDLVPQIALALGV